MRIGTGYDLHRLEAGRPLILGGVEIPFRKGPVSHSDGDVLAHAVTDAMLGAAALGNIGQHFPDSDPAYEDADSLGLLAETTALVAEAGHLVGNIDATIILEAPKLTPFLDAMRENLAASTNTHIDHVSVKAKTNEQVGPEGRGEAISVHAVVLLIKI